MTVPAAPAGGRVVRVTLAKNADGPPATLGVLTSKLYGRSLVFEKSGRDVMVSGEKLGFALNAGTKRIVAVQDASFAFRITQAGIAGAVPART